MGEERIAEGKNPAASCPRATMASVGSVASDVCPALDLVGGEVGSEKYLTEAVQALLNCRGFLWDVMLDGDWTGCASIKLRSLALLYGWENVGKEFEEGE